MKKLIALLIACILTVALGVTAFAAESTESTGTITITPPSGLDKDAKTTYEIYKVFDASGNGEAISYRLMSGKTTAPAGFTVDSAGNVSYSGASVDGSLTQADIEAIKDYVKKDSPVATLEATGTSAVVSEALPNGYYFITTTTGSLVTINSTNPDVKVTDKNSIPELDKVISGIDKGSYDEDGKKALAQVGTIVHYLVTIKAGKGAEGYLFHDTMSTGLSYNGDMEITGVEESKYTVAATPDAGDTITVSFSDGIAENTVINISYSATVTADALQDEPAKNTARLDYGENHKYTTVPKETKVYNAKFTVTKTDQDDKPLAGAGFVIKNKDGKYYQLTKASQAEGEAAATAPTVNWVDKIEDATEYKSDAEGKVQAFTGLADGTYTLHEKTTPAGYNTVEDSKFTIEKSDYTAENLNQTATIINQSGAVLPSTGGMGTTIFYLFGSLLVLGAAVLMVTRRRVTI